MNEWISRLTCKQMNNQVNKSTQRIYLYLWKRFIYTFEKGELPLPFLSLSLSISPPLPPLSLSLILFIPPKKCGRVLSYRELIMTWISLFLLFQFTPTSSFPSSLSLHIPFLLFPLCYKVWIYARSDVKVHKTFLLKVISFFLFSCPFICLSLLHLWLIFSHKFPPLSAPSLSLISLSHTHERSCERTLILQLDIFSSNEITNNKTQHPPNHTSK